MFSCHLCTDCTSLISAVFYCCVGLSLHKSTCYCVPQLSFIFEMAFCLARCLADCVGNWQFATPPLAFVHGTIILYLEDPASLREALPMAALDYGRHVSTPGLKRWYGHFYLQGCTGRVFECGIPTVLPAKCVLLLGPWQMHCSDTICFLGPPYCPCMPGSH